MIFCADCSIAAAQPGFVAGVVLVGSLSLAFLRRFPVFVRWKGFVFRGRETSPELAPVYQYIFEWSVCLWEQCLQPIGNRSNCYSTSQFIDKLYQRINK